MSDRLDMLQSALHSVLASDVVQIDQRLGELTLTVAAPDYLSVAQRLRDHPSLAFEQLIDLCGMDYSAYKDGAHSSFTDGPRFAVVCHMLSLTHNWRLRLRVFAVDEHLPRVASINPIWSSANWFEREAFDLFGIIFDGHEDLRRLLTDYGFIGHSKTLSAFKAKGIQPHIALNAIDADVIKTYVEFGLGIAIVPDLAYDRARDKKLRAIDASHLFEPNTIQIGIRRNHYLRGYMFAFIEMFAPHLKRAVVEKAITAMATRRGQVGDSIAAYRT